MRKKKKDDVLRLDEFAKVQKRTDNQKQVYSDSPYSMKTLLMQCLSQFKENHVMKTYKRTQRTCKFFDDLYADFKGFNFENLLKEELQANGINLVHVTFRDTRFKQTIVDLKMNHVRHMNMTQPCTRAEIHAMVVYLDDRNLQRAFRNADLNIGEDQVASTDSLNFNFSRKYKTLRKKL